MVEVAENIHAHPPVSRRHKSVEHNPRLVESASDRLARLEKEFRSRGVVQVLEKFSLALGSDSLIEVHTSDPHRGDGSVIFRYDPTLVGGEEFYNRPRVSGDQPRMWKSRGVKYDSNDNIWYIEARRRDPASNEDIPGGWKRLDNLPQYQEVVRVKGDVSLEDRLLFAFSRSTPSFDSRSGSSLDTLSGTSEPDGFSKKIV